MGIAFSQADQNIMTVEQYLINIFNVLQPSGVLIAYVPSVFTQTLILQSEVNQLALPYLEVVDTDLVQG